MEIIGPLIISTIAGLSTLIGAIPIFFNIKEKNLNKFISFCLSFSIAIMISISIFDLIPTSFFEIVNFYGIGKTFIILLIAFIISYIIITFLSSLVERESKGIDLYKLGILNMLVLILHNLPEGIATFLSSYHSINLGLRLSIAIMLHNIPEGISIAVPIYYATGSRKKAIKSTLISGLSEPLGAILAYIFLKRFVSELMISIVLIVVAGLMITLSIQEMLPRALKYKENKWIYLGLVIGTVLVIINVIIS